MKIATYPCSLTSRMIVSVKQGEHGAPSVGSGRSSG